MILYVYFIYIHIYTHISLSIMCMAYVLSPYGISHAGVMVADATQCSEGVSFLAVRRLHLADVPCSPSGLVQAVGRAIRAPRSTRCLEILYDTYMCISIYIVYMVYIEYTYIYIMFYGIYTSIYVYEHDARLIYYI